MSSFPRPTDNITPTNVILGVPFVEFNPLLASGAYGGYRNLGIIADASVAKAIELAQLRSAQSGSSRLVRELVRQFDSTLEFTLYNHEPDNLALMFAAAAVTAFTASTPTATNDPFTLPGVDHREFRDLGHSIIVEPVTTVEADLITDEEVGTSDGTLGDVLGEFKLAYKPLVTADMTNIKTITSLGVETIYTVGGTNGIVAPGAGTTGLQVEVERFSDNATSAGRLRFLNTNVGVALAAGVRVTATYRPSHAFVEFTDYVVDYLGGRIRFRSAKFNPSTEPNALQLKKDQPMRATYGYTQYGHHEMNPFTKFVFPGKGRVRLLTDIGRNIIWPIPSVAVRLTGDPFTFARDDFQATPLVMQLLDAGGAAPFGTLATYPETP